MHSRLSGPEISAGSTASATTSRAYGAKPLMEVRGPEQERNRSANTLLLHLPPPHSFSVTKTPSLIQSLTSFTKMDRASSFDRPQIGQVTDPESSKGRWTRGQSPKEEPSHYSCQKLTSLFALSAWPKYQGDQTARWLSRMTGSQL